MEQSPEAAKELRRQNRSYVFFREVSLSATDEAVGAQGVPLTAGRSIAVDKSLHVYGTPFFIEGNLPIESDVSNTPFRRLMVAQDTGSAIIGPARADIYFGAGADAGRVAGRLKNPARFVMLLPKSLDPTERGKTMPLPEDRPSAIIAKLFPPKEAAREVTKEATKENTKDAAKEPPKDAPINQSRDQQKDQPAAAPMPAAPSTAPVAAAPTQAPVVPLPEARPKAAPDAVSAVRVKPETPRRSRHHRRVRYRR
jgi:membrane-bound lytic murein transglycosylase A